MNAVLESLLKYVKDEEAALLDAASDLRKIEDDILKVEESIRRIPDRRAQRQRTASGRDDLSKMKDVRGSKNAAPRSSRKQVLWTSYIVFILRKHEKVSTKRMLEEFERMKFIPEEPGPERDRLRANARSAIGTCVKKKVIRRPKGANGEDLWELGPNAPRP